jgi:hypothetical protein
MSYGKRLANTLDARSREISASSWYNPAEYEMMEIWVIDKRMGTECC